MAKPITQTPILLGKDAVRFHNELEKSKSKFVSNRELNAIKTNAYSLSSFIKK